MAPVKNPASYSTDPIYYILKEAPISRALDIEDGYNVALELSGIHAESSNYSPGFPLYA